MVDTTRSTSPFNPLANPLAPRRGVPEKTRRIKEWVKEILELEPDVAVSVTELACRDEGCPDIETVIGVIQTGKLIETLRIHLPISDITRDDLAEIA
ncbi:nitrate reductase [Hoeflea sp. WL0058]|uniref:Nitrate reductase n=1 Tax=Flavimaribacter sediminis TaxID=2865987 RepID=A0AAE3D0G7_9HYPH|nr:nitrate reductase [Flavimaribacter sediminis]MBW8636698.1 nitrate reductase [Flavimaribacter sediminis]